MIIPKQKDVHRESVNREMKDGENFIEFREYFEKVSTEELNMRRLQLLWNQSNRDSIVKLH